MKQKTTFAYSIGHPHRIKGQTRGSNQAAVRLYNERLALSLIRHQGSLSKAEIAQQTGLSAQTISVILNQLESAGLVCAGEPQRGQVGQPRVPFSLNPDGALFFGLKIGRRSSDLILMDFTGNVRHSIHTTYPYPSPQDILDFVRDGVLSITGKLTEPLLSRIIGIGVGYPYEIWNWDDAVGAPQGRLEQWRSFDIAKEIEGITGITTLTGNDATGACAAELVFGNPRGFQNFLYLFIGTFIGGGVVLGGDLFVGPQGNAGAIGSMPVSAPGHRQGMQQLIGAASLYSLEKGLMAKGLSPSIIWKYGTNWDSMGETLDCWIAEASLAVAQAIVSSISVIDFEAIVIDGAFPEEVRRLILTATANSLKEMDLQGVSPMVLAEGTIGGNARAIGGACLPLLANFVPDSNVLRKAREE